MLESFVPQIKVEVDGERTTLYVHRQWWARPKADCGRLGVVAKLKELGLADDFVREDFNVNTLSGWVRELKRDGSGLPAGLDQVLEITEDVSVRGRNN